MNLPNDYKPYTDTYFLRSLQILQHENLNPFVRAQIFLRSSGNIAGISDAINVLRTYSTLFTNGGRVVALSDGDDCVELESVMVLEGLAQDIIPFETMMLGLVSYATTMRNNGKAVDYKSVTKKARQIVSLVGSRPVMYFGARHWTYKEDFEIAKAAFAGGITDASTDGGSSAIGKRGVGTIPHSLECIYAWKYGKDNTVLETTRAFDRIIEPSIPRIALVDFNNREVDDSVSVARVLQERLYGVRVDTPGENTMQGLVRFENHRGDKNWEGEGVTIGGVYSLRKALDEAGFEHVKIILTSGFANPEKVRAFVNAEEELGIRLFDSLGVGQLYDSHVATMDIVGVGETRESIVPISKVGRGYKRNPRLSHLKG